MSKEIELTLKAPPTKRGENRVNRWMYYVGCRAAFNDCTPESAVRVIEKHLGHLARPGEIESQVENSFQWVKGGSKPSVSRSYGETNHDALVELVRKNKASIEDIKAASPHDAPDHPLDVLRELHPLSGNGFEFLCLNQIPEGWADTLTFDQWERRRGEIPSFEMVVPNLMRCPSGTNKKGKPSSRCEANSCGKGGQRYIVMEFDILPDSKAAVALGMSPPDICASIILGKLADKRLRMVVHSGGKSLHAWLECRGKPQEFVEDLFTEFAPYGADSSGVRPEHQFRLPQGFRADKNAKQSVLYFNPRD